MKRRDFLGAVAFAVAWPARADPAPRPTLVDYLAPEQRAAVRAGGGGIDVSEAIRAANEAGLDIQATAGTYHVARSVAFTVGVDALQGAVFDVAAGEALTFRSGFFANPFRQVFSGPGKIAFSPASTSTGFPEWWGAQTGTRARDCLPGLTACVEACPITQLAAADYWISDTWKINIGSRTILGVGVNGQGTNPATRIIVQSSTADTVQIGPDTLPAGGPNAFLTQVRFGHITCTRSMAPSPPAAGFGGPSGLRAQFSQNIHVHDTWTIEHTNGFYLRGLVYCLFERSFSARNNAGTTRTNDYFAAWLLNGQDNYGLNDGNASLYIKNKCGGYGGVKASPTYGIYTINGFTDAFISDFETSSIQMGAVFNGSTAGLRYPSENLRLNSCVFDQVQAGIVISHGADTTNVSIVNCYCAPNAAGRSVGIRIVQTPASGAGGAISLVANEIIGAGGDTIGLHIENATGVTSTGNIFTDINNPIVLEAGRNCRIRDRISNSGQSGRSAAIQMTAGTRNVIDCDIDGAADRFPAGVNLSGGENAHNEVHLSGIDPACIRGGAVNKLINNGSRIVVTGQFGTENLALGLMS